MHKTIAPVFMLFLTAAAAFSQDFSPRPGGFVFVPAGEGNEAAGGNERFDIGGGGELGFDLDIAGIWSNPLGLGYTMGTKADLGVYQLDLRGGLVLLTSIKGQVLYENILRRNSGTRRKREGRGFSTGGGFLFCMNVHRRKTAV